MIQDLKDLKALFKLCRLQGVTEIKLNGVEIKFGELPGEMSSAHLQEEVVSNAFANFPKDELTPEQLMFYSSGGRPEDDPQNKEVI